MQNFLTFVSHETRQKLEHFHHLTLKWSAKLNLIQEKSLEHFWNRHIIDACQLTDHIDSILHHQILDIGSGSGIPGIVLSILGYQDVYLCEINIKRAIFLSEVVRQLQLERCFVLNKDVREIKQKFNIITARAFSSFDNLIPLAQNVSCETGATCLFYKGRNYQDEIKHLNRLGIINYQIIPSKTSSDSVIFKIQMG